MSDKERSKDEIKEIIHRETPEKKRGYGRKIGKAEKLVLFPFRKVKKLYRKQSSSATKPGKSGCHLCFMQPRTSDSSVASQTSDPNNPEFSFESLKALIESNDFYSTDCNVHTDFAHTECEMIMSQVVTELVILSALKNFYRNQTNGKLNHHTWGNNRKAYLARIISYNKLKLITGDYPSNDQGRIGFLCWRLKLGIVYQEDKQNEETFNVLVVGNSSLNNQKKQSFGRKRISCAH